MKLLADLSESMSQTEKQLLAFVVIGAAVVFGGYRAFKNRNWAGALLAVVIVGALARGIGHGGP